VLEVRDLTKEFPGRDEPLQVLRGVNLKLSPGDDLAMTGPSGSGKSTLLHIIGGLDTPTSGEVTLGKQNVFHLNAAELAVFRNKHVGFVFQEHHLLPQLTVLENVLVPTLAGGRATDEQIQRARDLLDRTGLSNRLEHRPAELSGGERQRAAVARALINSPQLLLADEPTGSLDRNNALAVAGLLMELQKQEQNMLIVVTHSSELAGMLSTQMEFRDGVLHNA